MPDRPRGADQDVKTFIRAMRTVVNRLPDAEGWIAGPEDERPAGICRRVPQHRRQPGPGKNVKFLGFQKIDS